MKLKSFLCHRLSLLYYIGWSIVVFSGILNGQIPEPGLPDMQGFQPCVPDTSGYIRKTVCNGGCDFSDLQIAINTAQPGTVLILNAGETYVGGFTLPEKPASDQWICILSSRMDLLPASGIRIQPDANTGNISFPKQKHAMPKIVTNNVSGIPCFATQAKAHHYYFAGLEILAADNVTASYGLMHLGTSGVEQMNLIQVPNHLIVDRCYIHGHDAGEIMKFGIRLDCAQGAVLNSHISGFHSIGYDAQAISGINGPGPFWIVNNYLEASRENILFGGGATSIPGLVPSDMIIRNNYFTKPWSWRVGHPDYGGKHWTIKNLFELKTGKRVLLEGNVLENSWADLPIGQSGYAILLTVRTEGGGSPQADISDITIRNNIIRHCGAGIAISGSDDGIGLKSKRIAIRNNLWDDINGNLYGDLNVNGPNDGTFLKIGEPEDVIVDHNTILQTGPITWAYKTSPGFQFKNNIALSFPQSVGYQGIYGPGVAHGNATLKQYFPDITDANLRFHKNVLIGDDPVKYNMFSTFSKNDFPSTIDAVGFINYNAGGVDYHNYQLNGNSIYKNTGTDGLDLGVNFAQLDSAFQYLTCPDMTTHTFNVPKQEDQFSCTWDSRAHQWIILNKTSKHSAYALYNILGVPIQNGILTPGIQVLNCQSMNSGIYFLFVDQRVYRLFIH